MKLIGYLIISLIKIIDLLLGIYTFILAVAVFMSWVNPDPYNPIVRTIGQLTDPVLDRIRRKMPASLRNLSIDISPIIALIIIILIQNVIINLLSDAAKYFLNTH